MIRRLSNLISIVIVLVAATTAAQTGGTMSPFSLGAGSRELALGGSNFAACDFGTAAFWNPSRLALSERYTVTGFHTRLYDSDVAYQYFGVVIPTLDWGSLGISVFRLGVDGIEKRDADNFLLGTISDERLGFRLGYGRPIGSLNMGVALSMETHSLDSYKATSSPGLDIAASKSITTPLSAFENITLSVVARNIIAPSMRLVDEAVKNPLELQAGVSARTVIRQNGNHALEFFGGLTKPELASASLTAGAEYSMLDMLSLRAGMRDEHWSFGAGVSYRGFSFDYAVVNRDLGSVHMITLTSAFGASASERREHRARRQEEAFNRAMSERLTKKNTDLAQQLLASGKTALASGNLSQADADFDRALFLIRGSGADTTEYAALAASTRDRLTATNRQAQLTAHLDSARVRLQVEDYLGCQYFAGLALAIDSNSTEAMTLRSEAEVGTQELTRNREFVQERILTIDSLLGYGAFMEALAAAQTLSRVSPNDAGVAMALRKAEFESFQSDAQAALVRSEFSTAITLFDSALSRFPGQNRCLELRKQCRQSLAQAQAKIETPVAPKAPLGRDVLKKVQNIYARGQSAFADGNLIDAISQWEEVERLAPGYQSVREFLVKAYRFVGVDLYSQNRLKEAMENWVKALAIEPENAEITAYMRRTQNEINRLKEFSNGE